MTSAIKNIFFSLSFVILGMHVGKISAVEYDRIDTAYYRNMVKNMFYHAYNGYITYAYPYDELRPLTCDGHDTWGSYSLTLIDALDTLAVMGNYSEFRRVSNIIIDRSETFFDMDINVSVFETNIRVVGGLLSAHLLMRKAGMQVEPGWPCSGPFLRMAENIARRLLPAFDTPTGMPYGTVNLRHGVPKGETTVTCTAGVGTFILEFGTLSRLTGDPVFEKVAMRAIRALWKYRSPIGLLGNHVDVATGKWTALDSGIGGGVDSYFEYLVKGAFMFNIPELLIMFREYEEQIVKHLKRDDWYMWANMKKGGITLPLFTSLDAFWPGIQSMLGDLDSAMKTIHNFHQVWKQFGSTPEYYNIPKAEVHSGREGYPLRPELIESIVYLYQATRDPFLLKAGVDIVEAIEHITRTSCGYATIKDVRDHRLENRMESFFLAETTKYLYLLFDTENFLHNNGSHGDLVHTPNGDCVLDAGGYVFNTEAHPIDLAAVHCCSAAKKQEEEILWSFHDNLNLLELLDIVQDKESRIVGKKLKKKRMKAHEKVGDFVAKTGHAEADACTSKNDQDDKCGSEVRPDQHKGSATSDLINRPSGPEGKVADSDFQDASAECMGMQLHCSDQASGDVPSPQVSAATAVDSQPVMLDTTAEGVTRSDAYSGPEKDSQETHSDGGKRLGEKNQLNLAQQLVSLVMSLTKHSKIEEKEVVDYVPNVKNLYSVLANYSISYGSNPAIMRCPAQPFHSRISVWGEMFLDEEMQ